MKKIKNILVVFVFVSILFGFGTSHFLVPDKDVSIAERRKLIELPVFSPTTVMAGDYMSGLESYFLDHFPLRDKFRTLKANMIFDVLKQMDNNGIYVIDDSVYKSEKKLSMDEIKMATNKINWIYNQYLQGMNVSYSIVPDKNYFVPKDKGYPEFDYDSLLNTVKSDLSNMNYIDIFDCLTIDDYYRTDPHWKQENLGKVVSKLTVGLGCSEFNYDFASYKKNTLYPFYGAYMGQSALPVKADELVYLTSPTIDNVTVWNFETEETKGVYAVDKFTGMDAYDVFMHGAAAMLVAENPNAKTDKELIIFRDSFGSSLAPLLLENYSKVTLLDIRYFASPILGRFVEFNNQDVLFLYSTSILNSGSILK